MLSSQETSSLAIYGILFCDIQSLRGHFVNDSLQFAVTQLPDLTASYPMPQTQPCSASTAFKPKDVGDHSLADPFPAQPPPPRGNTRLASYFGNGWLAGSGISFKVSCQQSFAKSLPTYIRFPSWEPILNRPCDTASLEIEA